MVCGLCVGTIRIGHFACASARLAEWWGGPGRIDGHVGAGRLGIRFRVTWRFRGRAVPRTIMKKNTKSIRVFCEKKDVSQIVKHNVR